MTREGSRTTFMTVGEALERVELLCGEIALAVRHAAEGTDDERLAMTRDVLAQQQDRLACALKQYHSQAPTEILGTYLQYTPELGEAAEPLSSANVTELAASVLALDNGLETALRGMAEAAESEHVADVFCAVADLFGMELRQMAREAQEVENL